MIRNINKEWFQEHPRSRIDKIVSEEIAKVHVDLSNISLHNQEDRKVLYHIGVATGRLTYLMMIRYLCVDPTEDKPWCIKKSITSKLGFEDFKSVCQETAKRLLRRPPMAEYSALVHFQTLTNLLTMMEFNNGR